jgi:chromosome segregation ATPase
MEQTLLNAFHQLQQHVKVLSSRYEAALEELKNLKQENDDLKNLLEDREKQLEDFRYQVKISKIVEHLAVDGANATLLKNQIDEYLKEIDNCIAYLEKEV